MLHLSIYLYIYTYMYVHVLRVRMCIYMYVYLHSVTFKQTLVMLPGEVLEVHIAKESYQV